jgi:predicted nucleic acid-binding Zn ribbon protein
MTKDNTVSIGDAFKQFLKDEHLEQRFNEKKVVSIWKDLMGDMIANRTLKLFIKDKVLFVTLSSAPLKQELTGAKQKVIEVINNKIGTEVIKDVRFM